MVLTVRFRDDAYSAAERSCHIDGCYEFSIIGTMKIDKIINGHRPSIEHSVDFMSIV